MMLQLLTILHESDEGGHMFEEGMMDFMGSGIWMWILMLVGIILVPLLTIWTYQDANRINENAILWTLVVFLTMGFGLIFYALARNPERSDHRTAAFSTRQSSQNNPKSTLMHSPQTQYSPEVTSDNKAYFCEYCGASLALSDEFCSKCGKEVFY